MAEESKHEHKDHEHKEHEHEAHKHMYMEHHQHAKHESYKLATWILAGLSVLLLVGLILALTLGKGGTSNGLSPDDAKLKVETYLKGISNGDATVDSITDSGNLYVLKLTVAGRQYDSYASKDGSLLFPQGIDLTVPVDTGAGATTPTPTNVPKTDKPVVELFVMSYCPYGTQAEKGMLPAARALGDKIDFKIRFVYYAMHGEKEVKENLNQYCIQKEQPDKFVKYLACFLNSTDQGSDATVTACLKSTSIDTTKLDKCKTAADTEFNVMKNFNDKASWLNGNFPKFDVDAALNTKYGIGGSPTLIINGVEANAGRDSASYLKAICAAFNTEPSECSTTLSSTQPGPGFGYDSVGSAQAAGCGV
jgi:hypothetical protein